MLETSVTNPGSCYMTAFKMLHLWTNTGLAKMNLRLCPPAATNQNTLEEKAALSTCSPEKHIWMQRLGRLSVWRHQSLLCDRAVEHFGLRKEPFARPLAASWTLPCGDSFIKINSCKMEGVMSLHGAVNPLKKNPERGNSLYFHTHARKECFYWAKQVNKDQCRAKPGERKMGRGWIYRSWKMWPMESYWGSYSDWGWKWGQRHTGMASHISIAAWLGTYPLMVGIEAGPI